MHLRASAPANKAPPTSARCFAPEAQGFPLGRDRGMRASVAPTDIAIDASHRTGCVQLFDSSFESQQLSEKQYRALILQEVKTFQDANQT